MVYGIIGQHDLSSQRRREDEDGDRATITTGRPSRIRQFSKTQHDRSQKLDK